MRPSPQFPEDSQCPICRTEVSPGEGFCGACGSRLGESPAQEIRSLNYLLSELLCWEEDGLLEHERAKELRKGYEQRRDELRSQLPTRRNRKRAASPPRGAPISPPGPLRQQHLPPDTGYWTAQPGSRTQSSYPSPGAPFPRESSPRVPESHTPRRALLETLADPHTIRLLLYTGAAMLVVGVVIWLRDILYLKLQEPIVQATLLITGTTTVTVAGWLTILRTRLRLTGRALTITGSLLVPVNFWFLVRAGLIENSGRAWLVCAFCAALYALTAAFLRERLYVYLASTATIATAWAIIYRAEREALGLYALSLMAASLVFLQLARLFLLAPDDRVGTMDGEQETAEGQPSTVADRSSSSSLAAEAGHELWGPPLVHVGLAGVSLSLLFYMPLRIGSSLSLADGILHLRANEYDPSVAILLFAAGAYASWFTGHYIVRNRRALLYTMSVLALFWTEFLAVDGLRWSGSTQLLLLSGSALVVALTARLLKTDALALALHRSSLLVGIALGAFAFAVLSDLPRSTLTQSTILALLAATYAASSSLRFCEKTVSVILAHGSAIFASIAFLAALSSLKLQSETSFYAACALWPFALYAITRQTVRLRSETQLAVPFMRVADAEFVLLILLASVVAVALGHEPQDRFLSVENLRGAMLFVLLGAVIYGGLRLWRDQSFFGAAIIPIALLIEFLISLRVGAQWFATAGALALFPIFFVVSRYAYSRGLEWLAQPSSAAANAVVALAAVASMAQALVHLRVGDQLLLAPCVALGAVALLSFGASLWAQYQARVGYFRVGLFALLLAFALWCLHAGFDPLGDVEIYTSPVAVVLLIVAYLSARPCWAAYSADTGLLLWAGSLLFTGPLLMHALQYRLFLDVPAPGRDLSTLCASLALLIFGIVGRMRAPVLVGAASLALELSALALTSVDWLQIPLKAYLMSTGAMILVIWGLLEFRREQILLMRTRFKERRETARERFGEWR